VAAPDLCDSLAWLRERSDLAQDVRPRRGPGAQLQTAAPRRREEPSRHCSTRRSLLAWTTRSSRGAGPGTIAIRNCASWPGIARAIACASMRSSAVLTGGLVIAASARAGPAARGGANYRPVPVIVTTVVSRIASVAGSLAVTSSVPVWRPNCTKNSVGEKRTKTWQVSPGASSSPPENTHRSCSKLTAGVWAMELGGLEPPTSWVRCVSVLCSLCSVGGATACQAVRAVDCRFITGGPLPLLLDSALDPDRVACSVRLQRMSAATAVPADRGVDHAK
jgi:hypothetical protein